jgi:hypothetical protein
MVKARRMVDRQSLRMADILPNQFRKANPLITQPDRAAQQRESVAQLCAAPGATARRFGSLRRLSRDKVALGTAAPTACSLDYDTATRRTARRKCRATARHKAQRFRAFFDGARSARLFEPRHVDGCYGRCSRRLPILADPYPTRNRQIQPGWPVRRNAALCNTCFRNYHKVATKGRRALCVLG